MIELDVMAESNGTFSLWQHGREVGFMHLFETDHIDEVTSNSCIIIRRGHMDRILELKHRAYQQRIKDARLRSPRNKN